MDTDGCSLYAGDIVVWRGGRWAGATFVVDQPGRWRCRVRRAGIATDGSGHAFSWGAPYWPRRSRLTWTGQSVWTGPGCRAEIEHRIDQALTERRLDGKGNPE